MPTLTASLYFESCGPAKALNCLGVARVPCTYRIDVRGFRSSRLRARGRQRPLLGYGALTPDHVTIDEGAIGAVAFAQMRRGSPPSVVVGSETGRVGRWRVEGGAKHGIEWLADGPVDDTLGLHPLMTALARRQLRVARGDART